MAARMRAAAISMTDGWLPPLPLAGTAKYIVIVDALAAAIDRGELVGGDRLLPQRDVAARLGVDLTTVTRAYDLARQRGLIEPRGRAGSFVRQPGAADPEDIARIDTGMNMPPEVPGDLLARSMAETVVKLLADGSGARLHYQPAGGGSAMRAAGARLIGRTGIETSGDQVVVTAGGQNALHAILCANLDPGDAVACGQFVYSGFKAVAARLGLRLVSLAAMEGDTLADACRREKVRALYVVPTNDNPTAATIEMPERLAIAEQARRHDLIVVEDDAYGELCADRTPPIATFAPERSWYVASVSKTISPGLRVAYVHAPDVGGALRVAADVQETAVMAPPLNTALVGAWLDDGTYDRLLDGMRREATRRQTLAGEILNGLSYRAHARGYHLWLTLPQGMPATDLTDIMRPTGLSLVAGERFRAGPGDDQHIRVSLGGSIDLDRLGRALRLLRAHIETPSPHRTLPI
jgi:DNA-binding transcriptional MocR family regulator